MPFRSHRRVIGLGMLVAVATAAIGLVVINAPRSPPSTDPDPNLAGLLPPAADPIPWQGVGWVRGPDPAGALGGPLNQSIRRIVLGGPGLVAVGTDARGLEGAQEGFGAVWLSATGADWREIELSAGVRPGDTASADHIVAGPAGLVVAGGVCCGEERPAIWWSADGTGWERIPLPDGVGPNGQIIDLAAGPDGYVAVGSTADHGAIWTSSDGRTWRSVDPSAADLLPGTMNGVARADDSWIAVGRIDGRVTADGGAWTSADLSSWHRVPDAAALAGDDEVELYRPVPFAGGILAIGGQGTHEDRLKCEQFGADARLASIAQGDLAFSCGWTFETHYLSTDGLTWERLPDLFPRKPQPLADPLPPHRLISWTTMVAGGPGLVVVDAELVGRADASNTSALWTSVDGRTWTRVGNGDQLPPGEIPVSVVVVGRKVVAAGEDGQPDGTIWIGTVLP